MERSTEDASLYKNLRQHYTSMGAQLPTNKKLFDLLKLRFDPEEAELGLMIPLLPNMITLEELVAKSGKSKKKIQGMIDSMIDRGSVFVAKGNGGQELFGLWDFIYSLFTPTFGDGIDNDERRKVVELREKLLWQDGYSYMWFGSQTPLTRVLPFEDHISSSEDVAPYERASHIVEEAKSICVVACGCRASVNKCFRRINSCIHFDDETHYWTKYRRGRNISKGECLQLLRDTAKEGLVHLTMDYQVHPSVICTCDPCCCVILRPYIEDHNPHSLLKSNFIPQIDKEKCKSCFTCLKSCPVKAIGRHLGHDEGEKNSPLVLEERCIGCAVCSAVCPTEAISLKRIREVVPPSTPEDFMSKLIEQRIW